MSDTRECRYKVGVEYDIPEPTARDMERMLTVGYVCDCGCRTRWLPPDGPLAEGPPMLGSRGDPPTEEQL